MTFVKRHATVVDLELSYCANEFNTYPCGNEFLVDACDDATTFTPTGAATSIDDAAGGITIVKGGTERDARAVKGYAEFDLEDSSELRFTVTIIDAATLAKITYVRVFLREGAADRWSAYDTLKAALVEGANSIALTVGSPTSTSGTVDRKGIDQVRLAVRTDNAADTLAADDIIFGPVTAFLSDPLTQQPCYNTRTTCRAPLYYSGTTTTVRLLPSDQPIANVAGFRCVTSVTTLPTQINANGGVGEAGRVTITCADWMDEHVVLDPYHRRRPRVRSPFWPTLKARNKHYSGRYLYLRHTEVDDDGNVDIDNADVRQYVIERIEGPTNGLVKIVAKDLTTRLSIKKIPTATTGELSAAVLAGGASLPLKAGAISEYVRRDGSVPTAGNPIWVRVGDEIIKCEEHDGDELKSLTRAQFGTTAAGHDEDASVQLCRVWSGVAVEDIWQEILEDVGTDATLIDDTAAAAEATAWFVGYDFTACLSEPRPAKEIMESLLRSAAAFTWWDAENQVFKLKGVHPPSPTDLVYSLDEERHIVGGSIEVSDDQSARISRAQTYLGISDWSKPLDEPSSYDRQVVAVDVSAESVDEYDEVRDVDTVFGYWIPSALYTEATAATQRRLNRLRDGITTIKLRVTEKDAASVVVGETAEIEAMNIVDESGAMARSLAWILSKKQVRSDGIEYEYRLQAQSTSTGRPAFWAPDGLPDYAVASDADKAYAYWGDSDDTVDGTDDAYTWV